MTEQALLRVEDLSVSFRSERGLQIAVQHITFDVFAGKTLAIVGESGSGKSVSSLSIMQLLQKGKAVFENGRLSLSQLSFPSQQPGYSFDDEYLKTLRGKGIAMIFQEPMTSLNPVMKCGEQIAEMLHRHNGLTHDEAKRRTVQLLEEVRLPRPTEMADQYPFQLSGGQRQRVMIAMAISCNPKILIADEPTTALDVTVQKEILMLLKSLQQRHGMGIIFITHDFGVVAEMADDIVVMSKGEIVEKGTADEILTNPKHAYTKGLLACRPVLGRKVERLLTVQDFMKDQSPDVRIITPHSRTHQTENKILEVKNLSKIYESSSGIFNRKKFLVRAVNDVTFSIGKGETLGLVGESGCGKTTLSRMLLGLIPSSEGEILFDGKNLTKLSKSDWRVMRKEMQIIFQDPYSSLNPKHTVGESIVEPMMNFGLHDSSSKRKSKTMELLQQVGLGEEHYSRYPHEFSGGQRQRIVIARALACEPAFIICDESVSALDVSVQAQVLNLLNDLKRDFSLTYLFISHDLGVVYHMSDRIMVMNKGCIEEIGTCDEVFFQTKSEYTKRLLDAVPGRS
ncbi:MAG: ABC transporter ATP-binding protein [Flavobacteriales bacterium]